MYTRLITSEQAEKQLEDYYCRQVSAKVEVLNNIRQLEEEKQQLKADVTELRKKLGL